MKNKVLNYVKENGGVSYVEIEGIFENHNFDWKGNLVICSSENPNVIFWQGWNEAACNVLNELLKSDLIERTPCEAFIYLIDGKALKLPVAKRDYQYKKEHWLPVVFNIKNKIK